MSFDVDAIEHAAVEANSLPSEQSASMLGLAKPIGLPGYFNAIQVGA
jgi:hypothetical protein